jgi:predicted DNA-binding transcriptional regulator YafY
MSRTERLFELLQILRRHRYPVSGQNLAKELGISVRTLYRDVATLQGQGADIEGESGVGYVLRPGFLIPPMMFSQTEMDAVMLGMRWVSTFADRSLSKAAIDALAKIGAVLPPAQRNNMGAVPLRVGPASNPLFQTEDLSLIRDAIRRERKVQISYRNGEGTRSARIVWPFAIGYFPDCRIVVAWCEKRKAFRHFRTDRLLAYNVLETRYPRRCDEMFRTWKRTLSHTLDN